MAIHREGIIGYKEVMILDSHFHYSSMLKKGFDGKLTHDLIGIDIGTDAGDIAERKPLLEGWDHVLFSQASGPWVLDSEDFISIDDEMERLRECIDRYGASLIGEIGLDKYWNYGTEEEQVELFERQLDLAHELNLPVIIHNRDADKETIEILEKRDFPVGGIIHCFSADEDFMERAIKLGFYISFAGNVTYKSNRRLQECAKKCPIDRMLYETDSPYLAPVPMRGKPNRPEYTDYTSEFIADLREMDTNLFRDKCIENFRRFLKTDL